MVLGAVIRAHLHRLEVFHSQSLIKRNALMTPRHKPFLTKESKQCIANLGTCHARKTALSNLFSDKLEIPGRPYPTCPGLFVAGHSYGATEPAASILPVRSCEENL